MIYGQLVTGRGLESYYASRGFTGVGLDIESEAQFYQQIIDNPWGLFSCWPRGCGTGRLVRARIAYDALVDRIRTDGWRVENYWFPLIADERRAASGRRLGESRARVRRLGMIGA